MLAFIWFLLCDFPHKRYFRLNAKSLFYCRCNDHLFVYGTCVFYDAKDDILIQITLFLKQFTVCPLQFKHNYTLNNISMLLEIPNNN